MQFANNLNTEGLKTFLADVNALKLRFPVVMIASKTGDSRANVSCYIRGRKPASRQFMIRFYTAFKQELAAIGIQREVSALVAEMPPEMEQITEKDFLRSINSKLSEQLALSKEMNERSKRIEEKLDELLRGKNKEIRKSAKEYLLNNVATLLSSVE